ncbi:bifunctional endoribonuclease/protein kinase ire1, partial [Dimargaris xerosporica]
MWYLWFAVLALHGGLLILADLGRLLPPSLAAVELARCCGVVSAAAVEPSSTTSPPLAGTGGRSMEPLPAHELQVYRGAPPQARFSPVILVATVDGFVSALNASSGQILWTRDSLGGPVVQNLPVRSKPRPKAGTTPVKAESRSQDRPSDAEDPNAPVQWVTSSSSSPSPAHPTESSMHAIADIHLVAPFDSGKIYKLKPDKVLIDSLLTVKELVHKSPSRSNGMLYLGSKRTKYFALDVATGRVVNAFGVDDGDIGLTEHGIPASWRNNDSPGASPLLSQIEDRHTIYLARTEYRLRIYNSHTGELKWNVLYSEYEPDSVLPITQHPALHASQQLRLFTSHQGVLVAQDPRTEEVLWTQQLPSSAATIFRLWTYGSHNPWMLVTAPLDRLDPSDTTPPSNTPRRGQASGQPVALHSQYTTHSALVDTTEAGGLFVYPGPAPVTNTAPSAKPGVKQIIQTVSRKLIEKITSWPRVARTGHSSTKPTPTSSDTIDEWSLLGKCDPTFRSGPPYTAPDTDSNNSRHHNEPDARGGQKEPLADTAFACGLEHAHHASCLVGHYNVLSANENQHLTGSGLLESTSSPQLPPSSPAILDPVFYHNDHHPHRWAPEPSIVIHYPAYQDMRLMPTYRNGQLIPPTFPTPDAYQIARYPSLLWRILGLLYQGL